MVDELTMRAVMEAETEVVAALLKQALSRSLLELLSVSGRAQGWRDRKAMALAPLRLLLEHCVMQQARAAAATAAGTGSAFSAAERASSEWWFGRAHEIFSVAAVTMNQLQLERAELLTARMMRSVEARSAATGGGGGRAQLALLRARMLSNSPV